MREQGRISGSRSGGSVELEGGRRPARGRTWRRDLAAWELRGCGDSSGESRSSGPGELEQTLECGDGAASGIEEIEEARGEETSRLDSKEAAMALRRRQG